MNGQPPARFAFVARTELMRALGVGPRSIDMRAVLRSVDFRHPDGRTIDHICYGGQLMKYQTAGSILRGFQRYADSKSLIINGNLLDPNVALTEFDSHIPQLGATLFRGQEKMGGANFISDIAVHAGVSEEVVKKASTGKCVLMPSACAQSIAVATAQVLQLPMPLKVVFIPQNVTELKPLGGYGLEEGKPPHKCPRTRELREDVLLFLNKKKQEN